MENVPYRELIGGLQYLECCELLLQCCWKSSLDCSETNSSIFDRDETHETYIQQYKRWKKVFCYADWGNDTDNRHSITG